MQGAVPADALNEEEATAFVGALTNFDKRMNQVVVDSGILKGIPEGRLKLAGEPVCDFWPSQQA